MKFRFRFHRGGLADSMETVITLNSKEELLKEVIAFYGDTLPPGTVTMDKLIIGEYVYDQRVGWDTHIVIVQGIGPVGFTDSPVDSI